MHVTEVMFLQHRETILAESPGVVLPASTQFLLPVHPCLVLWVHKVLVYSVLIGESSLHFTNEIVDLFAAVLVDGAADGPDGAELEPQLDHARVVVAVVRVHLQHRRNTYTHHSVQRVRILDTSVIL